MTTFMGTGLGGMVPVKCLSGLRVQPDTRADFATNLAGARRVYVDPATSPARRVWSAQVTARMGDVGTLVELESLRLPLRMVTDEAAVSNVLPPAASLGPVGWAATGGSLSQGGPVVTQDGPAAASIQASGTAPVWYSPLLPVVPGQSVTGSAYVRKGVGATSFRIDWMGLGAGQTSSALSFPPPVQVTATAAPLSRQVVTATVPAGVHVARLRIVGAVQVARPALSWTDAPAQWAPGMGAEAVHLSPLPYDVLTAWQGQALANFSYTVTEVG